MNHFFKITALLVSAFAGNILLAQHPCAIQKQNSFALHNKAGALSYEQSLLYHYDTKYHKIDLQVEENTRYIKGSVITKALWTDTASYFTLELNDAYTIDSIYVNGTKQSFQRIIDGNITKVNLSTPAIIGQMVTVQTYYQGDANSNQGIFGGNGVLALQDNSWNKNVTCTMSSLEGARNWYPCKTSLRDKIDSVDTWITTSLANQAAANGVLQQVTPIGTTKHRYEWKTRYPIDYYLIGIAVADYNVYDLYVNLLGVANPLRIQNFLLDSPGVLPALQDKISVLAQAIPLYSEKFGTYPFHEEKYGQCMCPIGGGMEHQTMTTINFFQDDYTDFVIQVHELGHQWFGDHVTCKSWGDIFVNEGITSYLEYIAFENIRSYADAQQHMAQVHQNVKSEYGGSMFINPLDTNNETRVFSSRLTYDKGSAFMHMIRYEIGNDSTFFQFLKNYQQQYSFGNASVQDFKHTLETNTARDWTQFFDQWFYGQGYPFFEVRWAKQGDNFTMISQQSASSSTPLFITPIEYRVQTTLVDTFITVMHDVNTKTYNWNIPGDVIEVRIDPKNWILNDKNVYNDNTLLLAIPNIEAPIVGFFPNPIETELRLQIYNNSPIDIQIYDVTGKLVYTKNIQDVVQNYTIDANDWQTGMYIAHIKNKNGQEQIKKIIKN